MSLILLILLCLFVLLLLDSENEPKCDKPGDDKQLYKLEDDKPLYKPKRKPLYKPKRKFPRKTTCFKRAGDKEHK